MKKVTIIIPVYNSEKYIGRCLDSIVNQSFKDIDILVINDGSTDKSKEIVEEYQSKYRNIKLINQDNIGVAKTRNKAIKLIDTKYIMFIDNDDYIDKYESIVDDELSTLNKAIDDMKSTLKKQEEYKNQMYQNISHDFKTPLTVIKSHIEAIEDGIMDPQEGGSIIKEQVNKLEIKVHSLLYLNKLVYLKDIEKKDEKIDIKPIIESSVDKFKIQRPDVEFIVNISGKTIFNGTLDMWEAIIDNLLNNFMRYAIKEIKITIKNNKITLYNDGPHIDPDILNNIFTPYKKGIKGQFGLGLSIVKNTLNLLGYEITVNNEKKGICFIIK